MTGWMKRSGLMVLVVVMALGVVGTAAAQGPRDGRPGRGGGLGARLQDRVDAVQQRARVAILRELHDATGLTLADVVPEMRDGLTLYDVLAENDMDPDAVAAQVVAELAAEIQQAVENERITQERADTAIENLPDAVDRVLTATIADAPLRDRLSERFAFGFDTSLADVIADQAGVDAAEMLRDVLTPPTLGEVAEAYDLDTDAVLAEAEARITERVNAALDAGTLTEDQAAQILDGLAERLANRLDAPLRDLVSPRNLRPNAAQDAPLWPWQQDDSMTDA